MKTRIGWLVGLAGVIAAVAGGSGLAAELLVGQLQLDDGSELRFSLSGESREQIMGGEIRVGARVFRVAGVSRLGLIGGTGTLESTSQSLEFAVFSSSFSDQTAVGQPWVAAEHYDGCDRPYNSFLAIYRVEQAARIEELGETPYPILVEDLEKSDSSEVFCFISRPP